MKLFHHINFNTETTLPPPPPPPAVTAAPCSVHCFLAPVTVLDIW